MNESPFSKALLEMDVRDVLVKSTNLTAGLENTSELFETEVTAAKAPISNNNCHICKHLK